MTLTGDTAAHLAPHTGRTPDAAEGATALSLSRFFSWGSFVMLPLSRVSLPLSVYSSFLVPRGSGFIPGFEEPTSASDISNSHNLSPFWPF